MTSWRAVHTRVGSRGPTSVFELLLFGALWPLSCLFAVIVRVRRLLYERGLKARYRASVPVISVGNLTVGGTGKTPMVDELVKRLRANEVFCAVVSRGYGGNFSGTVGRVNRPDGSLLMTPDSCGDEPFLLARRNPDVPVYVARKRADGVRQAERDGAGIIVLDDGFQHLAVARDLDILLLDAARPFGNGHVLPAGILREPVAAARRSDLIVLTRAGEAETAGLPDGVPLVRCRHRLSDTLVGPKGERHPLSEFSSKRCLAFAGIARPELFFDALRHAGLSQVTEFPLDDHQAYSPDVLHRLKEACRHHDLCVTTEKDAVKLDLMSFPVPCYQVGLSLSFDSEENLLKMLDQLMESTS